MSARLRFRSSKTLKDLASNTLAKDKFRVPYTKKTTKQKGFYFVKDEGIYVMNGYANEDPEDNLVVYALGYDPHKDDDVWERSWRAVGRDDFAESIPLSEQQLTRLLLGRHLVLEVSETSIKIEV
jgi:hypothetical protein